jgi:hypothetical protein
LTVPAGTPESAAVETRVQVDESFLQEGLRFAAPGSANTVKCRVLDGERSLIPTADSDPTVIPGATDRAPVRARLTGNPTEVTVRAFAPASDFPHTVTVVLDTKRVGEARPLQRLIQRFTGTDVGDSFEAVDTVDPE